MLLYILSVFIKIFHGGIVIALIRHHLIYTYKRSGADAKITARVSFDVSFEIARCMKPFSQGEFVKNCFRSLADALFPEKKPIVEKISLSRNTVARRIEDISQSIEQGLAEKCTHFDFSSRIPGPALDESTDVKDTAQLAIYVRRVTEQFDITEELLSLNQMKGTATGEDILRKMKSSMERFCLT